MYKHVIRPILFLISPEAIHHMVVVMLNVGCKIPGVSRLLKSIFTVKNPSLSREVLGLKFASPVGLAAGFDKNGEYFSELSCFGFSFIEVGTVTPRPQGGNPKPRSFRLIPDHALVNRMGFNNKGVNYVKYRLAKKRDGNLIIGGNIGKNTDTPNSEAIADYLTCFNELYPLVDYIAVNISCPNVCNLRDLQDGDGLSSIVAALMEARRAFGGVPKPIILKISPDLTEAQLDSTIDIAEHHGIDGYIATNTTTSREGLVTDPTKVEAIGNGGLSGAPLTKRSTEVIRHLNHRLNGTKPIIGVGGIMNASDAIEKLDAGATLVQVYTGFIYDGPAIAKRINKAIIASDKL